MGDTCQQNEYPLRISFISINELYVQYAETRVTYREGSQIQPVRNTMTFII